MRIVLVNCFDTYRERVENVYEYFVSKGHEVYVIVSDFKHFAKMRNDEEREMYIQIHVPAYQKNISIERLKSHVVFAEQAVKKIEELQPTIIYALIPPNMLVKELSMYRKQHEGVKLIYDIIDLWPETMPIPFVKNFFPFTIWKNLRDKDINCSDYVITECNLYQKVLEEVLDENKTSTLHLVRRDRVERVCYTPNETLDICYLGSINNIIDTDIICKILELLSAQYKIRFHVIGKGENKFKLMKKVSEINVDTIDYGTIYNKKEKMAILSHCDFGLNIMKKTVCVGLTMKSIDYFEAGIPIINNIQGDTFEFVDKYNVGINLEQNGILDLDKVNAIKENMDTVRNNVYQLYEDNFSYDAFVEKMDEILASIM